MSGEWKWETPEELCIALAKRVQRIRKRKKISQKRLSELCGVSYGSIKRFEQSGNIALLSLARIAMALGCEEELRELFGSVPYRNLDEVIRENRQR